MKILPQVLVCAFNAKGHVLTVGTYNLPYGSMLPEESQLEAAVRVLKEQTGFVIDQYDLQALMYDVIKGEQNTTERHVLSYLCTKVLESGSRDDFQSTQAFLANCYDLEYNHNALMCASELSTQQRLPWSKTCYTATSTTSETTLKETEMTNETTQPKTLILKAGGTYLTKGGEKVTLSVTPGCGEEHYHQFLGNNSYYYTKHGEVWRGEDHEQDILSGVTPEVKPTFLKEDLIIERRNTPRTTDATQGVIEKITQDQRQSELKEYNRGFADGKSRSTPKETMSKFYTATEVMSLMEQQGIVGWKRGYDEGLLASDSLSTSEIQSLITQQSKVIFELECEISELKELQSYLGKRSYIQEVQDLRKAVFNKMTTKQKRLSKLVNLQIKLKRSK
jgi:ADP-ribose pyrophosphatase YjhB (NUDIX family)